MYGFEKTRAARDSERKSDRYGNVGLRKAWFFFGAGAVVIIACGIWLAYIGKELSELLDLGESFIGSLFLGFATTLPEISVSVAALLIGAKEIAVANMLGSNLFNMTIIFIDDIIYRKAALLQVVSRGHIWSAAVVMAMTAVVIIAMVTGTKRKFLFVSWYAPVLFIIFLLGAYLNFLFGSG